ncbi:MAG: thioredoxin family protein [Patescibacteria group bacterium]|nr:thioredoxin family protein [Actinomycetota bacterium]MCL5438906.1 thioredoxin family protein [Patescibacteria group bacterium]
MSLPKIIWTDQQIFKRTPLFLVVLVTLFIGFNVFVNLGIKKANQDITQIEKAADKPLRVVNAQFSKKIVLGEKSCPNIKAGNPDASLKFKLFESETCPYCVTQNKVLDQILPEYGDLFYGEWYELESCVEDAKKYQISGVPTFIFTAKGVEKPPAYGFLDKQQLTDYICKVSEQC